MRIRTLFAALAVVGLPAASAAAQAERGVFLAYALEGGASGLSATGGGLHGGYGVGGTGPSGAYAGVRLLAGVHRLRASPERYLERHEATEVEGGEGFLYEGGAGVEGGWKVGPLRPYGYTGYHFLRQVTGEAVLATDDGELTLPEAAHQGFSRARGYGVVLLVTGGSGVYAERYSGGGRSDVAALSGTRLGLRFAW
jgi:hypothetical protein